MNSYKIYWNEQLRPGNRVLEGRNVTIGCMGWVTIRAESPETAIKAVLTAFPDINAELRD